MRKTVMAWGVLLAATPVHAEGLRAELHGGYDRLRADGDNTNGLVYGIGVGFDKRVPDGKTFGGVELNLDDSTAGECQRDFAVVGDRACAAAGRDFSGMFRVGVELGEVSTLYMVGGYSNLRASARYELDTLSESESESLHGARVGAGFQLHFGPSLYGKIEYRYTNYEQGFERHQAVTGLGIRF